MKKFFSTTQMRIDSWNLKISLMKGMMMKMTNQGWRLKQKVRCRKRKILNWSKNNLINWNWRISLIYLILPYRCISPFSSLAWHSYHLFLLDILFQFKILELSLNTLDTVPIKLALVKLEIETRWHYHITSMYGCSDDNKGEDDRRLTSVGIRLQAISVWELYIQK